MRLALDGGLSPAPDVDARADAAAQICKRFANERRRKGVCGKLPYARAIEEVF
jgi:hypothetical protein